MDGLTEGRIVHFVTEKGQHHAALVVKVWDREKGLVNLAVFDDSGLVYPRTSVLYDAVESHEKATPSRWHWIEKA